MDILQAILLGLIQGATEFIPVSSSGHLVLVPWLLGWDAPGLVFDTVVHWGTLRGRAGLLLARLVAADHCLVAGPVPLGLARVRRPA